VFMYSSVLRLCPSCVEADYVILRDIRCYKTSDKRSRFAGQKQFHLFTGLTFAKIENCL